MIGETLYTYDRNRRTYIEGIDGRKVVDPSGYWRAHVVTGETRTSWILGKDDYKVDKRTLHIKGVREFYGLDPRVYTHEQMLEKLWGDKWRRTVIERVERADVTTLKKIAALLELECDV